MSFTKKINNFLDNALSQGVINQDLKQKLQIFAENYERKPIISLLNFIGLFGGIAIILGLILIVSHNWHQISNFIKITTYILILVGFHISAYLLSENYPKISRIIYFIASGYVLAGIGLVAQIYHLSSKNGEAYLMWFFMILPMALLLRDGWIGVMSIFGFYLWVNINANINFYTNWQSQVTFITAIFSSMILLPKTFNCLSDSFNYARLIGYISLGLMTLVMGFTHEVFLKNSYGINLHPITIAIIAFNLICLATNLTKEFFAKTKLFDLIQLPEIIILVLTIIPLFAYLDQKILVSILYWVVWFWSSVVMIYKGEIERSRELISVGIWFVMIGLIARFLDLVGTMLFTGSMFIIFGIILIAIAFVGEKYRKRLINNLFKNHVTQK
jgi:uncharacterized membrane protein